MWRNWNSPVLLLGAEINTTPSENWQCLPVIHSPPRYITEMLYHRHRQQYLQQHYSPEPSRGNSWMIISGMNYTAMRMNEPVTPHGNSQHVSLTMLSKKSDIVEFMRCDSTQVMFQSQAILTVKNRRQKSACLSRRWQLVGHGAGIVGNWHALFLYLDD